MRILPLTVAPFSGGHTRFNNGRVRGRVIPFPGASDPALPALKEFRI